FRDCAPERGWPSRSQQQQIERARRFEWLTRFDRAAAGPAALRAFGVLLLLIIAGSITAVGATATVTPSADSYMSQGAPDSNFGGDFSNVAGALGTRAGQ